LGENGHIAFNDPGVADFADRCCRLQQVGEGHFPDFDSTPLRALTFTRPASLVMAHPRCRILLDIESASPLEGEYHVEP
jgi:glucosamine-6-phosphate deaminase